MGIESVQAPKTPFSALMLSRACGDIEHRRLARNAGIAFRRHRAGLFVMVANRPDGFGAGERVVQDIISFPPVKGERRDQRPTDTDVGRCNRRPGSCNHFIGGTGKVLQGIWRVAKRKNLVSCPAVGRAFESPPKPAFPAGACKRRLECWPRPARTLAAPPGLSATLMRDTMQPRVPRKPRRIDSAKSMYSANCSSERARSVDGT